VFGRQEGKEGIMSGTSNERITESTPVKALDGLTPPVARTVRGNRCAPYRLGQWTKHLDPAKLEPCEYGYHYVTGLDVFEWLRHDLYVAETCPDHPPVAGDREHVTCRLRIVRPVSNWDDRTRCLFAADCAESALLGERVCGREPDSRSWEAVTAARRYADGKISAAVLESASDAAWAAAWASAGAAAEAAACAAAKYVAEAAARAAACAARASARAAAWASAEAAAWAAAEAAAWAAAKYVAEAAGSESANTTLYTRWLTYVNGDPIPPVEPLYGEEKRS
jgi:hypothetical protein